MTTTNAVPHVCTYLETIGNTPMVRLDRSVPTAAKHATILCKLEMQNPGGSLKDRIALNIIEQAEARGEISPDKTTIVDFTSGNTGIGTYLEIHISLVAFPLSFISHMLFLVCN
jgi:cysteine synthase